MKLHFDDGVSIDTAGPYRIVREKDGLYVVGRGMCTPIDNREEGEALIALLLKSGDSHE
jgi:hypothetical protein